MKESCVILLVEDDLNDAFFVRRALEMLGFNGRFEHVLDVEMAKTFLTALQPGQSSVVIADSSVSCRGSGVDLLEWTRNQENTKTIPFFILSGDIQPQLKQRANAAGVSLILTKPPNFADIAEPLRQVLTSLPAHYREWLK